MMGRTGINKVEHSCPPGRLVLAGFCLVGMLQDIDCCVGRVRDMHEIVRHMAARNAHYVAASRHMNPLPLGGPGIHLENKERDNDSS